MEPRLISVFGDSAPGCYAGCGVKMANSANSNGLAISMGTAIWACLAPGCGDEGLDYVPPGESSGMISVSGSGGSDSGGSGSGGTTTGSGGGTASAGSDTGAGTGGTSGGVGTTGSPPDTGGLSPACPHTDPVTVVEYQDENAFLAALAGDPQRIDFDDVGAPGPDPEPIDEDRYVALGILIEGQSGQFAHGDFGRPVDNIPVSSPNMYAPGPPSDDGAGEPGGHETRVRFQEAGAAGCVSGFGLYFVDPRPESGAGGALTALDVDGAAIGTPVVFEGESVGPLFRGIVVVDEDGDPVPAMGGVQIINGPGWPGGEDATKGMPLDDFIYDAPAAAGGP